ncbi:uncharacterized protein TNCT_730081 [Trichonephila clavata]|uniref:HD domain-containing protein n=1 Tax=Trichonephila clavata TaxID=2740835 RepID=A0A8X6KB53_TRICU|nr:uncharacterized protein TNCT_730081 [Trichonephila clavata]
MSGVEYYAKDSDENEIYIISKNGNEQYINTSDPSKIFAKKRNGEQFYAKKKKVEIYPTIQNKQLVIMKNGSPIYAKNRKGSEKYPRDEDQKELYARNSLGEYVFAKDKKGFEIYAKDKNGLEFLPEKGVYVKKVAKNNIYPRDENGNSIYPMSNGAQEYIIKDNKPIFGTDTHGNEFYAKDIQKNDYYPFTGEFAMTKNNEPLYAKTLLKEIILPRRRQGEYYFENSDGDSYKYLMKSGAIKLKYAKDYKGQEIYPKSAIVIGGRIRMIERILNDTYAIKENRELYYPIDENMNEYVLPVSPPYILESKAFVNGYPITNDDFYIIPNFADKPHLLSSYPDIGVKDIKFIIKRNIDTYKRYDYVTDVKSLRKSRTGSYKYDKTPYSIGPYIPHPLQKHFISSNMDSEFCDFLSRIFPSHTYPDLFHRISTFEWLPNPYHHETFRQHCVSTAFYMERFCLQHNLLQGQWNNITYAFLVGFLHDIGKPLVFQTNSRGKQKFTGHAQVSARLVYLRFQYEIPEDELLKMVLSIDSHMCSLRSNNLSLVDSLRINSVLNLCFSSPDIVSILKCLHKADGLGKSPPVQEDCFSYSPNSPITFRKDKKIVIFLIGPSGSGKSTLASKLLSYLKPVEYLERDKILMQMAMKGESYQACYKRVHANPTLKKEFQTLWNQTVTSAASKTIVIVDTVQSYYHINTFEFPHHFRIGIYCIPMNFIDKSLIGKNPNPVFFPPKKWMGYPRLLTECRDRDWNLEFGTGVWQIVPHLIEKYLNLTWNNSLELQPTLIKLWNQYPDFDAIRARFNHNGIIIKSIHSLVEGELFMVTYLPGSDVTYGETRFYRGEIVLWIRETNKLFRVRGALPTFRRTTDFIRDFDKIIVTPKYDGSLQNVLFIPANHFLYKYLEGISGVIKREKGLFFMGSKQKLIAKEELRKRWEHALNIDTFFKEYIDYFQDNILKTLHFEIMLKCESVELTVQYSKNFVKFLGVTIFDDETQKFSLPKLTDANAVEQTPVYNLKEFENYSQEQHEKFLKGDEHCEPEGFVLYVWKKEEMVDIIKIKFMEYLAMNKPEKFPEEYKRILTNSVLRQRFQKCGNFKNLKEKVKVLEYKIIQFFGKAPLTKKCFVFYINENSLQMEEFQKEINEITESVRYIPLQWIQMRFRSAGLHVTEEMLTGMVKYGLFDMEKLGILLPTPAAYNSFVQNHLQGHVYTKFWKSCAREYPQALEFIERQRRKYLEDYEMSSSERSSSPSPPRHRSLSPNPVSATDVVSATRGSLSPRPRSSSRSSSSSRRPTVAVRTSRRLLCKSKIGPYDHRYAKKAGRKKSVLFIEPTDPDDRDKNLPGNICRGIRRVCRYRDKKTKKYINFLDDGSEDDEYVMTLGYT